MLRNLPRVASVRLKLAAAFFATSVAAALLVSPAHATPTTCTIYEGSGYISGSNCIVTSNGTLTTSQPRTTPSVALRDDNYGEVNSLPSSARIKLYYTTGTGEFGTKIGGFGVTAVYQPTGSGPTYAYSRCKLMNESPLTRSGHCWTRWHT